MQAGERGPSTKKFRKKFNRNVQAGERGPSTKKFRKKFNRNVQAGERGPSTKKFRKKFNRNVQAGKQGPNKEKCPSISTKTCPSKVFKNNYIFMYRNGSYQSSRALIDFFVGKSRTLLSVIQNHTSTSIRCVVLYMCR